MTTQIEGKSPERDKDGNFQNIRVDGCEFLVIDEVEVDEKVDNLADDLFHIDTHPDSSQVKRLGPRYRREFDDVLTVEDTNAIPQGSKSEGRCFNCLGDHTVLNCPLPKDLTAIAKNRRSFFNNQTKQSNRYHEESKNKFSHLKPGQLSNALREALGLKPQEVPLYIYQMRLYGYPPGWIEEIKCVPSGIEFLDSDTPSSPSNNSITYNIEGIIEYPGFNTPLDAKYRDDWQYLNFPPMHPMHSKEHLIQQLMNSTVSLLNGVEQGKVTDATNHDEVDMELSSDISIEELENQRQALLAELAESNSNEVDTPEVGEKNAKRDDLACVEPVNEQSSVPLSPASPKPTRILEMGTPVSIRFSPYSALPSREKFADSMGELLMYENLPDSTGRFTKMKVILNKIRKTFKRT